MSKVTKEDMDEALKRTLANLGFIDINEYSDSDVIDGCNTARVSENLARYLNEVLAEGQKCVVFADETNARVE